MEKKKDVYVLVAEKLIEQLKQGTAPWQKPWSSEQALPMNASTGKRYKSSNALMLAAQERNDPRWLTYKQAEKQEAQVRKGEHGTPIVYWKFEEEQTVRDKNGKAVLDAEGKPLKESVKLERPRSFVGYVFNAEQIDGLPPLEKKERTWNPVERADALLQSSGAKLEHRTQGRAFYRPSSDTITLPEKAQFAEATAYYATALHELGHWTGHESRLNRDMRGTFGSESYAREELRAEIASMMVGDLLGIGHNSDNHAAYVKSWIKALEDDPREIHRAAADAAQEQAPALPPREEFAEALRELGFKMDGEHPMMDGSPHRVALEDDKAGERTGFYIGYLDGRPAGYAKNNRTDEQIHWKSSGVHITPQERNALQAENTQKMQERAETLRQTHDATAQRIIDQMSALHEASTPTPYMVTKNISIHAGVLVHGDGLTTCLPAQNVDGHIRTMQYIREDGSKRFAKDSSKEGCFHPVGGMGAVLKAPALVVCEGYATACSLSETLGFATIAAFDASNVVSVAKALHEKYPDRPLVIAGDDDQELATRTGRNPGREKAERAAQEVGGQAVFPIFAPDERGQKAYTDFNDLAVKSRLGAEAVIRQVTPVVRKALELKTREREQQRAQSRDTGLTI